MTSLTKVQKQAINVYGYLRASTAEQNAERARGALESFANHKGFD